MQSPVKESKDNSNEGQYVSEGAVLESKKAEVTEEQIEVKVEKTKKDTSFWDKWWKVGEHDQSDTQSSEEDNDSGESTKWMPSKKITDKWVFLLNRLVLVLFIWSLHQSFTYKCSGHQGHSRYSRSWGRKLIPTRCRYHSTVVTANTDEASCDFIRQDKLFVKHINESLSHLQVAATPFVGSFRSTSLAIGKSLFTPPLQSPRSLMFCFYISKMFWPQMARFCAYCCYFS